MRMKHIPNILSACRILIIPFFARQFLQGNMMAAALLLVLSGITDLLDGFLARRYGWISQMGKVLDPVADKLTQITVCVLLAIRMPAFWWVFVVLLTKEVVMLALGGYLLSRNVKLDGSKWFGKVATTIFYAAMTAIIVFPNLPGWLVTAMFAMVIASSLVAAFGYLPDFFRYKNMPQEESLVHQPT